jgi:ATP-dependent Clp protease adaptor protein ClpS
MSREQSDFKEKVESRTEEILQEPIKYKILMHNDDYTTMDFVVQVLETVFNKSPSEAVQIMLNVHRKGIGVCGIFTAEVAETKVETVHSMARQHGFPLKCSMEEV